MGKIMNHPDFGVLYPIFRETQGSQYVFGVDSTEEVGLWRRQLQPLPPRRPLMGCWISTGFLWTGWFRIWLCHLLPSLGTFKDVGHWEASRFTFMGMGRKKWWPLDSTSGPRASMILSSVRAKFAFGKAVTLRGVRCCWCYMGWFETRDTPQKWYMIW